MTITKTILSFLLIAALWLLITAGFWHLLDDWSWNLLFPLTGFAWMAAPLLLTRFNSRSLVATSGISLLTVMMCSLALIAGAIAFLGLIVSGLAETDPPNMDRVAADIAIEAIKIAAGTVAGAVTGIALRGIRNPA